MHTFMHLLNPVVGHPYIFTTLITLLMLNCSVFVCLLVVFSHIHAFLSFPPTHPLAYIAITFLQLVCSSDQVVSHQVG